MSAKIVIVFCAQALFMQLALGYCHGNRAKIGACGYSSPGIDFKPTVGGAFPITAAAGGAPIGLSVRSENTYEGILTTAGELPFVGTVGVEGLLPTEGVGAVNHRCGDGVNAMASDNIGYPGALAPGLTTAVVYESGCGFGGTGCGCGSSNCKCNPNICKKGECHCGCGAC